MKTKFLVAAAAALALSTPAFSHGTESMTDVHAKFKAADTNHDGSLSQAEWSAAWPDHADKWSEADANNDGKVTWAEKKAFHQKMMKEHKGKHDMSGTMGNNHDETNANGNVKDNR